MGRITSQIQRHSSKKKKKNPPYQTPNAMSHLRSGQASKVRAFLRKLDRAEAAKPAKTWVDPL